MTGVGVNTCKCPVCGTEGPKQNAVVFLDGSQQVVIDGEMLYFSGIEYRALRSLAKKSPVVVTGMALYEAIDLSGEYETNMKVVPVVICRLRKRLQGLGQLGPWVRAESNTVFSIC
jgi:DNA-binding response OmpR family regulator